MGDRQMLAVTPDELAAAKKAIFRPGIPAREYLDRQDEINRIATDAIKAYVQSMRGTPALALLRIAAEMAGSGEREVILAVRACLDLSDPEDAQGAFDNAFDELNAYARTHWHI